MRQRYQFQRGQGMTEYIVIVALVAVSAIGTYSMLGQTVRSQTSGLALEISGKKGEAAIKESQGSSGKAQTRAKKRKGLDNYHLENLTK